MPATMMNWRFHMNPSFKCRLLIFVVPFFCINPAGVYGQEHKIGVMDEEFSQFAIRTDRLKNHFVLREESRRANESQVDEKLLSEAIKNSAAWIKAVLKPEYTPAHLETHIEGLVGCTVGNRYLFAQDSDPVPRDCTRATFETDGYKFLVMQDASGIAFLVAPVGNEKSTRQPTPDELARELEKVAQKLFHHAAATWYLKAVRVSDFGVELADPYEAWYSLDERWKSTVIIPPPSWEDGLLPCGGRPTKENEGRVIQPEECTEGRNRVIEKLRAFDPTMPKSQADGFSALWWSKAYAATDGHVVAYIVPKVSIGPLQWGLRRPDWFRNSDTETFDSAEKHNNDRQSSRRGRGADWPPQ